MCIDWTDELYASGNRDAASFTSLDFMFLPCNFNYTYVHGSPDDISDECIANQS